MGRTWSKGTSQLQIHLEGGGNISEFSPGDTITGFVTRKVPTVSPRATIKITLCGRAKSKIVISRNNNSSTYRGRFAIIDEDALSHSIYEGPLHIEGTAQRIVHNPPVWQFAIDLPLYCDPKLRLSSPQEKHSFLPLDAVIIDATPLPSTFSMEHMGFGTNREGFVEYFLKADINFTQQGSSHHHQAILPIDVRSASTEPPITDFKLQRQRVLRTFSSFKLLPGMEDAELSFTQKRQQLFGSYKVPQIGGYMELDVPRRIQLDNPNPIQIQLRFVPDEKSTSSNMQGIRPKVKLISMTMLITSHTQVRCPGAFSPHDANDEEERSFQVYPPPGKAAPSEPLYIPATEDWPPLDVGTQVGLRVPSLKGHQITGVRMHPDFKTYNIRHWHNIRVNALIMIGDRDVKLSSAHPLEILPPYENPARTAPAVQSTSSQAILEEDAPPPPFQAQGRSESWIHPPTDGDAPPTFAQVKKEDEIRKKSHDGSVEASIDAK